MTKTSRLPRVCVGLICLLFVVLTAIRAASRPLWYDELYTLYIARMGSPADIWAALKAGLDLNPPLLYLFTQASLSMVGSTELAMRIPAIAGFLLLLVSLYRIAARNLPAPYAFTAMLLPLAGNTYVFSYEGRPYAVMLGCSAFALLCWQAAASGTSNRRVYLWALAGTITAGIFTHCYAVMMLPSLWAGELVRTIRRRRVDWPVWAALCLPCFAVLSYLPLIGTATRGGSPRGPLFDPTAWKLGQAYWNLTGSAVLPLFAALLVVAYGTTLRRADIEDRWRDLRARVPLHELAAFAVYLVVPLAACVLAVVLKSGFFPRYGSVASVGFSLLLACGLFLLVRENRYAILFPVFLAVWFIGSFALRPPVESPVSRDLTEAMSSQKLPIPIVAADGQTFMQLDYYMDPTSAARLYFLTDRPSALRLMQTDCYDAALRKIMRYFPFRGRIMSYQQFLSENSHFLLYGAAGPEHEWVVQKLREDGVNVTELASTHRMWEITKSHPVLVPALRR